MKIFLIANKEDTKLISPKLKRYAQVIPLTSGEKDITKYSQLFKDSSEKIIAIEPVIIEWKIPNNFYNQIKNLKGIATESAWAHFINLKLCSKLGIIVTNVPGANSQSVAEYAIWMMLSLAKKLPLQLQNNFTVKLNQTNTQTEIEGKTMGIIGLGNIGSLIAKLGHGLGMNVIYWSRSKKSSPFAYKSFNNVLKQADFIFNCVELCDHTQNLLNKQKLSLMKPTACFISVLGGAGWGVQDDKHLVKMVESGKLAGFSVENDHKGKFKTSFKHNIFIPGAYAWYTNESKQRILESWTKSIISIVEGKPINKVN